MMKHPLFAAAFVVGYLIGERLFGRPYQTVAYVFPASTTLH